MRTLPLSADGQATVLACSALALGEHSVKPLSPSEWHALTVAMHAAEVRPRELLGLKTAADLREALGVDPDLAERLAVLLSRGGQLAFEVERLASRGVWILTRADDAYPALFKQRLRSQMPPVLFGAGPQAALQSSAIAIVGSREADNAALSFASRLAARCAVDGYAVVSGAARGVDAAAMSGALARGGAVIGVTVDPLERLVRRRELREAIVDEQLTLVTPFLPFARWHAGNAMRRNRLIYTLARAAVVVASSAERGGTRAGALENLEARWVPLYVRADGSPGTRQLMNAGGLPLPADAPLEQLDVSRLLQGSPSLLTGNGAADPSPPPGDAGAPAAITPQRQRPAAQSADSARVDGTDDAFPAVWPILARQLRSPHTEREVADAVKLELTQARAWLKRAVAEGYLEVRERPKRYVLRGFVEQLRIPDDQPGHGDTR